MDLKRVLVTAAAVAAGALGTAVPAAAQSYPPPAPQGPAVLGTQFQQPTTQVLPATQQRQATRSGMLPRTGQELVAVAALGATAVGVGAAMVATSRRRRA